MYKMTIKTKSTITLILLLAITLIVTTGSASEKYICNTKHISITEVSASCTTGSSPSATRIGNTLIISCGR